MDQVYDQEISENIIQNGSKESWKIKNCENVLGEKTNIIIKDDHLDFGNDNGNKKKMNKLKESATMKIQKKVEKQNNQTTQQKIKNKNKNNQENENPAPKIALKKEASASPIKQEQFINEMEDEKLLTAKKGRKEKISLLNFSLKLYPCEIIAAND